MFIQQKRKHGEVVFLTFRSVSKHIFALGVDPTAGDAGKGGGSDLVLQTTLALEPRARLVSLHVPSLLKSSITKPGKTSSKML